MRNTLAVKNNFAALCFAITALALVNPGAYAADASDAIQAIRDVVAETTKTSRLAFSEDQVKEPTREADPFLKRIQAKRAEFVRDRQGDRREFFEKLNRKELTSSKRREKILDFHEKQNKKMRKFTEKQRKKLDKHFNRKGST